MESVKCRCSKSGFSAELEKLENIQDGASKSNSKKPCAFCRRAGIDAALESAICSSRVHPPSKIKSNLKFKTLRWRLLRWRLTLSDKSGGFLNVFLPRRLVPGKDADHRRKVSLRLGGAVVSPAPPALRARPPKNIKDKARQGYPFACAGGCLFIIRMSETPTATTSKKVSQYTSNLYCNTPPICIAVLSVPVPPDEREILSVLPFISQCASHAHCNTPRFRIAVLLGKSWWLWSQGCSPFDVPVLKAGPGVIARLDGLHLCLFLDVLLLTQGGAGSIVNLYRVWLTEGVLLTFLFCLRFGQARCGFP